MLISITDRGCWCSKVLGLLMRVDDGDAVATVVVAAVVIVVAVVVVVKG